MSAPRAKGGPMGRPVSPGGKKGEVLLVRVSAEEKAAIEAAAAATGESVSAWVRRVLLAAVAE